MVHPTRRVVTGHDQQGRSVFLEDGPSPHVKVNQAYGGLAVTELWATADAPANNAGIADDVDTAFTLEPTPAGTKFRVVEYPPDEIRFADTDPEAAFREIGASHTVVKDGPHPGMHKTNSVDYAIVLSGEIWAIMDEGETLMKPGDCLVQRGTSHAWSNRTDSPARVAFILVGAAPV